jgi:hypothetical protein
LPREIHISHAVRRHPVRAADRMGGGRARRRRPDACQKVRHPPRRSQQSGGTA